MTFTVEELIDLFGADHTVEEILEERETLEGLATLIALGAVDVVEIPITEEGKIIH